MSMNVLLTILFAAAVSGGIAAVVSGILLTAAGVALIECGRYMHD